jgi:hypothetical protein
MKRQAGEDDSSATLSAVSAFVLLAQRLARLISQGVQSMKTGVPVTAVPDASAAEIETPQRDPGDGDTRSENPSQPATADEQRAINSTQVSQWYEVRAVVDAVTKAHDAVLNQDFRTASAALDTAIDALRTPNPPCALCLRVVGSRSVGGRTRTSAPPRPAVVGRGQEE